MKVIKINYCNDCPFLDIIYNPIDETRTFICEDTYDTIKISGKYEKIDIPDWCGLESG